MLNDAWDSLPRFWVPVEYQSIPIGSHGRSHRILRLTSVIISIFQVWHIATIEHLDHHIPFHWPMKQPWFQWVNSNGAAGKKLWRVERFNASVPQITKLNVKLTAGAWTDHRLPAKLSWPSFDSRPSALLQTLSLGEWGERDQYRCKWIPMSLSTEHRYCEDGVTACWVRKSTDVKAICWTPSPMFIHGDFQEVTLRPPKKLPKKNLVNFWKS